MPRNMRSSPQPSAFKRYSVNSARSAPASVRCWKRSRRLSQIPYEGLRGIAFRPLRRRMRKRVARHLGCHLPFGGKCPFKKPKPRHGPRLGTMRVAVLKPVQDTCHRHVCLLPGHTPGRMGRGEIRGLMP